MIKKDTLSAVFSNELLKTSYIRQSQLIPEIIPFSSATLWRRVKDKSFPSPVRLSKRVTAWRTKDIMNWLDSFHKEENTK